MSTTPTELSMDLPVAEVTVLEDRARVVRRGRVTVPAGQVRISIDGVAPVLVDRSLAAVVAGGSAATVLDARCERRLVRLGETGGPSAAEKAAIVKTRRTLTADLARLEGEISVATRTAASFGELSRAALAELSEAAAHGRSIDGAAERLARLEQGEKEALVRATARSAELARGRAELEGLGARLTTTRSEATHEAARAVVDLVTEADGEIELAVDYVVPGACWRPYHTAMLDRSKRRLELCTDACVWQATGEDWHDARLSFSTERPSLGVTPPSLTDDVLTVQRRSEVTVVEARDHDVDVGLGADPAARVAAAVPGIDDGGVALTLRATHPATVLADGRPYRVPVSRFTASAEVAVVAMPEKSVCAHVRARGGNSSGAPLLAGPVDLLLDYGYVGRTSILYVAPGERFDIGFGPDADVRVHRDVGRKRDEAGVLGTWNTTRYRVGVRLSNLAPEARRIEVQERVPVSEIEQVEVTVSPPAAWTLEDEDGTRRDDVVVVVERTLDDNGIVTWDVELPPLGRRAVALEYEVRAKKGVVGV